MNELISAIDSSINHAMSLKEAIRQTGNSETIMQLAELFHELANAKNALIDLKIMKETNNKSEWDDVNEFKKLCEPVNDWLQRNHNPHTKIIIEADHAELVQELMGAPYEVLD